MIEREMINTKLGWMRFHVGEIVSRPMISQNGLTLAVTVQVFRLLGFGTTLEAARAMASRKLVGPPSATDKPAVPELIALVNCLPGSDIKS